MISLGVQLTQGPSCTRPLALPKIFNGGRSFTDWICHFESVSAVNGWSDEDKLLGFVSNLLPRHRLTAI